jgi:hypothetical protein
VVLGNLDGRTGTSVTNAIEHIAAEIATAVLPERQFALLEYYPGRYSVVSGAAVAEFTPVTFDDDRSPRWGPVLTQEQVEAVVGGPVIVYPVG